MKRVELKVLHGLYFSRESVGDAPPFKATEVYWLANKSFKEGKDNWRAENGQLQTLEAEGDQALDRHTKTLAEVNKILAYLQSKGYITYQRNGPEFFNISVTGSGADIARDADTPWGRANICYKDHKTGILGLIITILISVATAYVTTTIKNHTDTATSSQHSNAKPTHGLLKLEK